MLKGLENLLVDGLIRLRKILSSLGMADNNVFHACIHKHFGRNLAGICALLLKIHILSPDQNIGILCRLHGRDNVNGGYAEHHVHVVILYQRL